MPLFINEHHSVQINKMLLSHSYSQTIENVARNSVLRTRTPGSIAYSAPSHRLLNNPLHKPSLRLELPIRHSCFNSGQRPCNPATAMALDPSSGFAVAAGLTDDDSLPIFDVQRVQLQFSIAASFVAAQVANNVLVLALSNGRILRIDLNRPEDIDGRCSIIFCLCRLPPPS